MSSHLGTWQALVQGWVLEGVFKRNLNYQNYRILAWLCSPILPDRAVNGWVGRIAPFPVWLLIAV